MKPGLKDTDLQRFIDLLAARARETTPGDGMTAMGEQQRDDGETELFLTIENSVEDRVRTYTRLLRKQQVLRKARR